MNPSDLGQVFTPEPIADFMVTLLTKTRSVSLINKDKECSILEPSAGKGIFIKKLKAKGFRNIDAFEIDPNLCKDILGVRCEDFLRAKITKKYSAAIGNPPYIRGRKLNPKERAFYDSEYETAKGQYDIYSLFFEKSIKLLENDGLLCFITSNKYSTTEYGKSLRRFILDSCSILKIVDASDLDVFKGKHVYPYIILLRKVKDEKIRNKNKIELLRLRNEECQIEKSWSINQKRFLDNPNYEFNIFLTGKNREIIEKIRNTSISLSDIGIIREGIHTGNIRKKVVFKTKINKECKPLLFGRDIESFKINWNNNWILFDSNVIERDKGEYGNFPDKKFFESPKIIIRDIGLNLTATYDNDGFYLLNTLYSLLITNEQFDPKFVLGLLNSDLLNYYFKINFSSNHINNGYLRFKPMFVNRLPIHRVDFDDGNEKLIYNKIIKHVSEILSSKNNFKDKKLDFVEKINNEVFDLYRLNKSEISLINGN